MDFVGVKDTLLDTLTVKGSGVGFCTTNMFYAPTTCGVVCGMFTRHSYFQRLWTTQLYNKGTLIVV